MLYGVFFYTNILDCNVVQGYARVFNMDQETALPRPDEDSRLEASLAVKANGAVP